MSDRKLNIHVSKSAEALAVAPALAQRRSFSGNWMARMSPALSHDDFKWLWISSFLSNIGTWMQSLAQAWLVFQLTHSSFWLGAVAFAFSIPGLLLAAIGGVVADHLNRRLILIFTQSVMMISAFTLAVLVFLKTITISEILLLAVLSGTANGINMPAYHSFIPSLVTRKELTNAVALNSAQFHLSRVLGPALGGLVIASFGMEADFFLNGISFLAPIIALKRIHHVGDYVCQECHFWPRLKEGFSYLFSQPELSSLLLLIIVGSLLALPYLVFIPYFARDVLHSNERGLGVMMACSGAGSLLGGATVAYLNIVKSSGKFLFGAGLGLFSTIVFFCLSRLFILSCVLLIAAGYASVLMGATANAIVQHAAADRIRGRVLGIYFTVAAGFPSIGGLLAGWLSHRFAVCNIITVMATMALVGSIAIFTSCKTLRRLD